jgi:hypothetical protein
MPFRRLYSKKKGRSKDWTPGGCSFDKDLLIFILKGLEALGAVTFS